MSAAWGAMMWKEWREQRWRYGVGTLLLAGLSFSVIRAQVVPLIDALLLIYAIVGLGTCVFYATGSVATERADGTWDFLVARPIELGSLLRSKWLVGAAALLAGLLLATVAAHVAAESRNLFRLPAPPAAPRGLSAPLVQMWESRSAGGLWSAAGAASVALLAWYTTLFLLLTRARNELHAGLGGLLLTIAALAWLVQFTFAHDPEINATWRCVLWQSCMLNPLAAGVFAFDRPAAFALAVALALLLWIATPVWVMGRIRLDGRVSR